MRTSRAPPPTCGQAAPTSALLLAALAAETRNTPPATISRPRRPAAQHQLAAEALGAFDLLD